MKQEKRISYQAGITRRPSDFLCGDGELAECINLTTDNEELKPMVQPKADFTLPSGYTLLYLHKFNNETRYICQNSGTVKWKTDSASTWNTLATVTANQVTSVGKVLIVSTSDGIQYFLWKSGGYTPYSSIPDVEMDFYLKSYANEADFVTEPKYTDSTYELYGRPRNQVWSSLMTGDAMLDDEYTGVTIGTDKQEQFNEIVRGLYAKNKSLVAQKKGFCLPFFVRYALRMYDGKYTNISNPILMWPSVTSNSYMRWYVNRHIDAQLQMFTSYASLFYNISVPSGLSALSDIVKGVDIFVSQGIDLYDITSDQVIREFKQEDIGSYMLMDGVFRNNYGTDADAYNHSQYHTQKASQAFYKPYPDSTTGEQYCLDVLKHKEQGELLKEIGETAIFYKICSIDLTTASAVDMGTHFDTHTLETLTARDRMPDDFFSRSTMVADIMYAYNMRLNLAGVKRSLFNGFDNFLPFDNSTESAYSFYVTINTDSGEKIVKHTKTTKQKQGIYFFYPDQRATHVVIMKGSSCVLNTDLNECKNLNGAYYLKGLPGIVDEATATGSAPSEPASVQWENLFNQIVTSEVDNPSIFSNKGYNKVGIGKIIGISTTTMALSQDQFGRTDLIVFTDSGLWGMQVDSTGLYESIHPMPREVCINPASITQVDGAVFFVSKKGLMVIGEDGIPRCVSEQMNGKAFNTSGVVTLTGNAAPWATVIGACQDSDTFLDYIRDENCMMAYDYVDARLLIINKRLNNGSPKYGYAYVYNIADGSINKTVLPAAMTNVVNNYPDYLLQSGTQVYTLYGKQLETEIQARQRAFILTRPIKLAAPLTVSSLRELVSVGEWQKKDSQGNVLSEVKTEVWISDDLHNWYLMSSRFGAAAKYFRIGLFINMLPTERISGTILMEQERRTDNKRA